MAVRIDDLYDAHDRLRKAIAAIAPMDEKDARIEELARAIDYVIQIRLALQRN